MQRLDQLARSTRDPQQINVVWDIVIEDTDIYPYRQGFIPIHVNFGAQSSIFRSNVLDSNVRTAKPRPVCDAGLNTIKGVRLVIRSEPTTTHPTRAAKPRITQSTGRR